jgi:choline dehydrogenase-like flavoprotein
MPNALDDQDILDRVWDFVVVGTGIGGGTLGYALARAGKSVLFCERGRSHLDGQTVLAGEWLEAMAETAGHPTAEQKAQAGRFSGLMYDVSHGSGEAFQPYIGIGAGGSSAIYGMVMERFFPADFAPAAAHPQARGANLPEAWPVAYADMLPHYAAAEQLYGVRATPDPLRSSDEPRGVSAPPPFSKASADLIEGMRAKKLHPYHVPIACESVPNCRECVGFLCPNPCKRDSANTCVAPAVRNHGAHMLTECEVDSVRKDGDRVSGVNARLRGQPVQIRAKTVVLAAGALHTPVILLRSGGPDGLANGSGQVGRNLMRHFIDYYLLYPGAKPNGGLVKQLALNDFYEVDGRKYGTVQSNGYLPPAKLLAAGVKEKLRKAWAPLEGLFPLVRPIAEWRAAQLCDGAYPMVAFCEDLPYEANRITVSPDRSRIELSYHISAYDQGRLDAFRRRVAEAFQPFKAHPIHQAHINSVLGHVCGTCRFGDDPRTSVLDRNNRAHELENLYVVDASFFPTSAGTNPSLTIAANALRVAAHLLEAA